MSLLAVGVGVADLLAKAIQLSKKVKDLELNNVLLELQEKLFDMKTQLHALQEENTKLKIELEVINNMEMEDGMYYRKKDGKYYGPYCSRCWEVERKCVTLRSLSYNDYQCPNCKERYSYSEDFDPEDAGLLDTNM